MEDIIAITRNYDNFFISPTEIDFNSVQITSCMSSTDKGLPIVILIVTSFIILILVSPNIQVNGQVRCPNGSHRSPLGYCEKISMESPLENTTLQSLSLEPVESVSNKTQTPIASNESLTYEDPLLGFNFQYPAQWKQILENNNQNTGVVFELYKLVNPSSISNGLYLYIDQLPENKTLKQYLKEYVGVDIDHQSLKFNEIKLGGISAINATWTLSDENVVTKKALLNFAIKDNVVYLIRYQTDPELFDKWLPQVKGIMKSYQITG